MDMYSITLSNAYLRAIAKELQRAGTLSSSACGAAAQLLHQTWQPIMHRCCFSCQVCRRVVQLLEWQPARMCEQQECSKGCVPSVTLDAPSYTTEYSLGVITPPDLWLLARSHTLASTSLGSPDRWKKLQQHQAASTLAVWQLQVSTSAAACLLVFCAPPSSRLLTVPSRAWTCHMLLIRSASTVKVVSVSLNQRTACC